MLGKIFHWLIIAVVVVVAFWLMLVCGEIFRAHLQAFLFLWFFLPIMAFWLGSKYMRSDFTISSLTATRTLLTCIMAFISMGFFANYEHIRDTVGYHFIEGYRVSHYEDTDDFGRSYLDSEVHTGHWYSKFGLWLFEIAWLLLVVLLPCVTWVGCTKGIEALKRENTENEAQKWKGYPL